MVNDIEESIKIIIKSGFSHHRINFFVTIVADAVLDGCRHI